MKKLIALFLLLTLALGGSATVVSAHCGGHGSRATTAVCAYVDDNCDGVCDNCGKCHAPAVCTYVDDDCNGVCDNCGKCHAPAACTYVDDDCDGVCDNCGECHAPAVRRTVRRSHHHGHCH